MRRQHAVALASALMLLLVPFTAFPAHAAEPLVCGQTISGETVRQPVVVPSGSTCTITNSQVEGTITVAQGGSLRVNHSTVSGDILSDDGHAFVQVWDTKVAGRGNFTGGGDVVLIDSTFGKTVNVSRNTGVQRVFNNTIRIGNLYCWGNSALSGQGNAALEGELAVQCANPQRRTQIDPVSSSLVLSSDGSVTITGYLRGYGSDGTLQPLTGKQVVIEAREAGATDWTWITRTAPTTSTGRFSTSIQNRWGQEVRLVYTSTDARVTHAYRIVGAMPKPYRCSGSFSGKAVRGSVIVPSGSSCTLTDSTVDRHVIVERNATLRLNASRVGGDVVSDDGHSFVQVWGSKVNGRGNFTGGKQVVLIDSTFGNTVNVNRNSGLQRVFRNTIMRGDLYCWGNSRLTGEGNRAERDLAVQCANPKRLTQIDPVTTAPVPNSDGTVTITGYLRGYDSRGSLQPMMNRQVVVETRAPGATAWQWRARTAPTTSTGRFTIKVRNYPGQQVRLVYTSTESRVSHAYRTIGSMPGHRVDQRCLSGARVMCASKNDRKLYYLENGVVLRVLDARFGSAAHPTREGVFSVGWKSRHHVSSIYGTAMPWAMFFSGGQAVHYSENFRTYGWDHPGSAGCINIRDSVTLDWIYQRVRTGDKVVVYR